jgi:hypothetical protein
MVEEERAKLCVQLDQVREGMAMHAIPQSSLILHIFRLHFAGGRGAIAHAGAAGGKGYDAEQGVCARACVFVCDPCYFTSLASHLSLHPISFASPFVSHAYNAES